MKNKIEKELCFNCNKLLPKSKIYRLSWRYNDKQRTYRHSKSKIVYTGHSNFCRKCLNKAILILTPLLDKNSICLTGAKTHSKSKATKSN